MITLEQHLAAHPLYYNEDEWKTSPWVCKCKWTPAFDPDDEFFEGLDDDTITGQHAAHVAATWREARTWTSRSDLDSADPDTVVQCMCEGKPVVLAITQSRSHSTRRTPMPEHNRLAGNCVHQSARATDDQVCRVPDCLDANPIEPSGISGKLPATSDVVQRARQALDAWPGQPITDDDRRVNAVIGSVTVAQYDLVRELADEVEKQRAEVDAMRAQVRDIHQPVDALNTNTGRTVKVCSGCGTDGGNWTYWPCRTIRALGEATS